MSSNPEPRPDLNGQRLRNSKTGTVYLIDDGKKRAIDSLDTYNRLFAAPYTDYLDIALIIDGQGIGGDQQLIKGNNSAGYYLTDFDYNNNFVIRLITAAGKATNGFSDNVNIVPQVLIDNIHKGRTFE